MQGAIYQRIINDVIESSQVDFEEGGVDQATLDELKQVSALRVSACKRVSSDFSIQQDSVRSDGQNFLSLFSRSLPPFCGAEFVDIWRCVVSGRCDMTLTGRRDRASGWRRGKARYLACRAYRGSLTPLLYPCCPLTGPIGALPLSAAPPARDLRPASPNAT